MNYYPFHLGDYAAHTAHLDPIEDIAYRRLLDRYYLTERALPLDVAECARQVRMREYVEVVGRMLAEFFVETPDGWRHDRCEAEIERAQEKSEKAKASAAASVASRQRTLNERSTNAQRPLNERLAPNSQEPITKDTHTPRASPVDIAVAMRRAGVEANSAHPEVLALAEQGVSVETVVAACDEVRRRKPGERLPVGYVAKVLESWAKRAAETRANGAQAPPVRSASASRSAAFMASLRSSPATESVEVIDVSAAVVSAAPRRLGP